MTRFASLVLVGLHGGFAFADDKPDVERAVQVQDLQLRNPAVPDEGKWHRLISIRRDIEFCDIITKMLVTFPKNFRNPTATFVETITRRAVLTETYAECWIFNTTLLSDAYESARPK